MMQDEPATSEAGKAAREPGIFSGTFVAWTAILALITGVAIGYFKVANVSRTRAFFDGERFGATEAACWTDSALLWLYSDSFTSEDAGRVALRLDDIVGSSEDNYWPSASDMTEAFGTGPERMAAEIYLAMEYQLAIRDYGTWSEPHRILMFGRDLWPDIDNVHKTWSGRAPFDDPAKWWSDFSTACARLYGYGGPESDG